MEYKLKYFRITSKPEESGVDMDIEGTIKADEGVAELIVDDYYTVCRGEIDNEKNVLATLAQLAKLIEVATELKKRILEQTIAAPVPRKPKNMGTSEHFIAMAPELSESMKMGASDGPLTECKMGGYPNDPDCVHPKCPAIQSGKCELPHPFDNE